MFALEWPVRLPPLLAVPFVDSIPGDTVIMVQEYRPSVPPACWPSPYALP